MYTITFHDSTFVVIGTVISMNIYSFGELSKYRRGLGTFRLWKVHAALGINLLIFAVKPPRITESLFGWVTAGAIVVIVTVLTVYQTRAKQKKA
jgi:hypothetical protein